MHHLAVVPFSLKQFLDKNVEELPKTFLGLDSRYIGWTDLQAASQHLRKSHISARALPQASKMKVDNAKVPLIHIVTGDNATLSMLSFIILSMFYC
jgi:hypothetical protein